MATKYLDNNGLLYFWQKIKTRFAEKTEIVTYSAATTSADGLMTSAMVTKLNGIATGANKTTVDSSLSSTSTNPVQNKVINTALGNKVDVVSGKGLSANDFTDALKTKLEGIATGATNITVDSALDSTSTNPVQNKVINTALGNKVDVVSGKGLSTNDFTDALKTKLDGIATGANKTVVDSSLSDSSANPVQNSVIYTALANKVDVVSGKGLSANDFTDALKTKLDGIATGATKVTVDSSLSSTSTNPLQNKAINTALGAKAPLASPALTGTPTAPTATAGTNTTQIATTAFVTGAVSTKVDVESGKGLSTNDFTDALKTKLEGIATGATNITVDTALSSSSTNPVQNKAINTALGAKAALASPTFTGTPKAPTAAAGTNNTQIATTAFVTSAITAAQVGASLFQGMISAPATLSALTNYKKGAYWIVDTAGTYAGVVCEPGDFIYCVSDYSSAFSNDDFAVVQANLDIAAITNAEIDTIVAA